jgi:DNA-directed RNA polymerase subunit L
MQVKKTSKKVTGTLHKEQYTFMILFRSVILRMRNVEKQIVEKIKTHILHSITFSRKSCRL